MKAKVISFINMKGGVGKTTLCKELGYYMARAKNKKMLFIDIDPQSNLTQSFFRRYGYKQKDELEIEDTDNNKKSQSLKETAISIEMLFSRSRLDTDEESAILKLDANIHIIPGTLNAVFTERSTRSDMIEEMIEKYLNKNKIYDEYDYIFIDCPPTYSSYTVASILPSDFYITPVKPDTYSILGLKMMYKVVDDIMDNKYKYFENKNLSNIGVVFTGMPRTLPVYKEKLIEKIRNSKVLEKHGTYIFDEMFIQNTEIPKKLSYFIMDNRNEMSIMNLSTLYDEFKERIDELEKDNVKKDN
ncbi:ParA family protein [Mammaliicoccus sciuri]|uniref:ParA family protein n=1 Tax=Mammaliicoccus sciuri TaxID=1296 RepID=UPI003D152EAE